MEKEDFHEIIMNNSLEIIIVFDLSGNILYSNKTANEKLGYSERMSDVHISSVLIKEFEEAADCDSVMKQINEKNKAVCYRHNKTCFRASVFCRKAGGTYYFFALDIEESSELEHELKIIQEMAERAMGVRNDFVANVTHELRTPVNGIRGHVENLKETKLTIEQKKTLDIIENCCGTMSAIINNILDFSKLEAGKIELDEGKFEFREFMNKIIASHMAAVNENGLQLSVSIDENIPCFLRGDEVRLTQILNNLISNAIKFTAVGFVKIAVTQTLRFNDEIELFFMVADSGIGIAREEQDKLFKSFSQVDASITRRYGGTGLGLVIAKELVELMNGRMYLESEKGKGSNFSFSIRLHGLENNNLLFEYKKEVEEFLQEMKADRGEDAVEEYYHFGSEHNRKEVNSRMEKMVLCIELDAWEKAEGLLEELKKLVENSDEEIKRTLLKLGMSVRKEDYDKSMKAYEMLKLLLEKRNGKHTDGDRL